MKNLIFIIVFLSLITLFKNPAKSENSLNQFKCLSPEQAETANNILKEKGFIIDFCSDCDPAKAVVRRINIIETKIEQTNCGSEIKIKGKIVRGIKPPVFEGKCSEELSIYNPSFTLDLAYEKNINIAYSFVLNEDKKSFITIAELMGLESNNICIRKIQLKK
jgi:hypothetical protein